MWRKETKESPDQPLPSFDHGDEFDSLLNYIDNLAQHKLGYPVSLLTYLGVIDNRALGIQPNSLANVLLNNVGDPFKDSETSLMEVKKHERQVIAMLEKYYGLNPGQTRGYVTTGGTEGNFAGLWWSKRYLISTVLDSLIARDNEIKLLQKTEQELSAQTAKIPLNDYQQRAEHLQKVIDTRNKMTEIKDIVQQLLTPTVFFTKNHTHYSVPKISEILRFNIKAISPVSDGAMDLDNFRRELIFHMGAHPHSPVVVIANIGTTITGAVDDVPAIKKILDELKPKPIYTIHLDGALSGFVMPIIKPFGDIKNYFEDIGVNTLAFSAHKYPGLSQPCGIILARKDFFNKAFEKSERSVDYVGNILDVTITGSRSGLNVLMFYNALHALGLHKGNDVLRKMVDDNIAMATYLRDELVKIFGPERVLYPHHFNVIFPRPSAELAKKYQLMLTGDNATICVLTNVTRGLIDKFILDLKQELQINLKTEGVTMSGTKLKTDYTIRTLSKEHMQSAADLFIKSFCDSEPVTKHLGISYREYEPFVLEVITKAVKDGMSVVAVDKNNKVIACTIAEDITNMFKPTEALYPKMKPVLTLLDDLSEPFVKDKEFVKGKIAHVWIAIVDPDYRGKGLSTEIDLACGAMLITKGYDFAYAEFTNPVSEKITNHYKVHKLCNSIKYDTFTLDGTKPFSDLTGEATAFIVGLRKGVTLETLESCYKKI